MVTTMTLKKILIADDEMAVQTVAKIALEQMGQYEVQVCKHGKEVLETLPGWKPDLIVLDAMMPVMDGPMTLKYIRKLSNYQDTPIVFLVDKSNEHESDILQSLGAIGVITKPFNPLTLVKTLQDLWKAGKAA
jgi:CheY-like chemotaxis protein